MTRLDICARWVKGDKGINVQIRNKRFKKMGLRLQPQGIYVNYLNLGSIIP